MTIAEKPVRTRRLSRLIALSASMFTSSSIPGLASGQALVITVPPDDVIECWDFADPLWTGEATATTTCIGDPDISFLDSSTQTNNGTCTDFTYQITRTWTATDVCGNVDSDDQYISVLDTTPPFMDIHPADVTLLCWQSTDPEDIGTFSANGDCDPDPVLQYSDATSVSCPTSEQLITRTWTAEDACGNSDSFEQSITLLPDNDEDGDPDSTDPDDDNDVIGDAYDTDPFVANNHCTGGDDDNATLVGESVIAELTCAARMSIDVQGAVQVIGPGGHLRLISPSTGLQSSVQVLDDGRLTAISGNPCPGCAVCGNGIVEAPEQCDDGNTDDGDGCSSLCRFE